MRDGFWVVDGVSKLLSLLSNFIFDILMVSFVNYFIIFSLEKKG